MLLPGLHHAKREAGKDQGTGESSRNFVITKNGEVFRLTYICSGSPVETG
jgi:hypothetical protein